jgi:hypothetical protein
MELVSRRDGRASKAQPTGEPGLHREIALVLACARTRMTPSHQVRVEKLLQSDLRWGDTLRFAAQHKLEPLLRRNLSPHKERLPQSVVGHLDGKASLTAARNLLFAAELLRVTERLEADGIETLPYRGPILAADVYGELGLRQFNDLDILVHGAEVEQARRSVQDLGYQIKAHPAPSDAWYRRSMHHYTFTRDPGRLILELHWDVAPRFLGVHLDAGTWRRARTAQLAGATLNTLCREDLLFILCIHGTVHGWERIGWICDVAELLRATPDLDWDHVVNLASRHRTRRVLRLALALARELLDATLPEGMCTEIVGDAAVEPLVHLVTERIITHTLPPSGPTPRFIHWGVHLGVQDDWSGRLRQRCRSAFVPSQEDWEALPLPASLGWLHPMLRPMRLLLKHRVRLRGR